MGQSSWPIIHHGQPSSWPTIIMANNNQWSSSQSRGVIKSTSPPTQGDPSLPPSQPAPTAMTARAAHQHRVEHAPKAFPLAVGGRQLNQPTQRRHS
eukprot:654457-Prymnesium_polylepis.3